MKIYSPKKLKNNINPKAMSISLSTIHVILFGGNPSTICKNVEILPIGSMIKKRITITVNKGISIEMLYVCL